MQQFVGVAIALLYSLFLNDDSHAENKQKQSY